MCLKKGSPNWHVETKNWMPQTPTSSSCCFEGFCNLEFYSFQLLKGKICQSWSTQHIDSTYKSGHAHHTLPFDVGPCQVQNPYLQSHDACWTWIDCPSVSLRRAQDFQDFRSSKGTEIKYKRDTSQSSQQSGKRHESMQNLSFGTRDKVFPCDPEFETWDCFHHPLPAATCQPKKARRWNYHSKCGYFTNISPTYLFSPIRRGNFQVGVIWRHFLKIPIGLYHQRINLKSLVIVGMIPQLHHHLMGSRFIWPPPNPYLDECSSNATGLSRANSSEDRLGNKLYIN